MTRPRIVSIAIGVIIVLVAVVAVAGRHNRIGLPGTAERMRIFISYSHNDEAIKNRLVKHLRVLQLENIVQDFWDDSRIAAGADWRTEIATAMTSADLGVLLISVDFLTSQFIREQEVPELLKRRVFPIIARACPWQEVQWLRQLQVRPKNGRPLPGGNKMDDALTIIARELARLAKASAATASSSVGDRGATSQVDRAITTDTPEADKKRKIRNLPAKQGGELGQMLDSRGSRTYQVSIVFGLVFGAVLTLIGVALCVAGVSGSIDWIVNGKGWSSKLMNASPGVFFSLLGFFIIMRYKPKYKFSFNSTAQGPPRKGAGKAAVSRVQGSGEMSALPDPKDEGR